MAKILVNHLKKNYSKIKSIKHDYEELTVHINAEDLISFATALKADPALQFNQLIDVCGIDYLHYQQDEWATNHPTKTGYSRARTTIQPNQNEIKQGRFAVVYHLLSTVKNHRIRLIVRLSKPQLQVPSICALWPSANWFERETYDLFGIEFSDHPDLRRILTDYGFNGHPFRKDFPVHGKVAMRYDGKQQKCVYEPTDIQPRNVIPKSIRPDNRYLHEDLYQ